MVAYFDYAATTPVLPEVSELVTKLMCEEYGNSGSRTHVFGSKAKKLVMDARSQIALALNCEIDEVIFTSGATESNNLAILGLKQHLLTSEKKHVISMSTEHKAVLEPLLELEKIGIEVSLLNPKKNGEIDLNEFKDTIKATTGLVSIMHVNNETGVLQPIDEICEIVRDTDLILHVDGAQSFGKGLQGLSNHRIDLISISGHKIYAPKGIGALINRKRDLSRSPLVPLMYGGGQERGLRPGTLPVALIGGLGLAAELSTKNAMVWSQRVASELSVFNDALSAIDGSVNGDGASLSPYIRNVVIPGVDAEAAMVLLKDKIAISNGSACTSSKYSPSHVLAAMGMSEARIQNSVRISFSHLAMDTDWSRIFGSLSSLRY